MVLLNSLTKSPIEYLGWNETSLFENQGFSNFPIRICGKIAGKRVLDLSPNNFRNEIVRFRARRNKNYEAYTVYLPNNFYKVAAEM